MVDAPQEHRDTDQPEPVHASRENTEQASPQIPRSLRARLRDMVTFILDHAGTQP